MTGRVLCLRYADWPLLAVQRAHGIPAEQPLAVLHNNAVLACSVSARSAGCRRGLRAREAQARCPEIELHPYAEDLDAHGFEPVVTAVEAVVPGVEVTRPGSCLLRVTGAARYYGGEDAAAERIHEAISVKQPGAGIGIADDPFTAEVAARNAQGDTRAGIVPQGEAAPFLAPLDIGLLSESHLVTLLRRLGVDTLGGFAALPATAVRDRFGPEGERAHQRAKGCERRPLRPRVPPRRFTRDVPVEPALTDVDLLVAAAAPAVADLIAELGRGWLACTELTLTLTTEAGRVDRRCWRHPRWFTATDCHDRLRWQLAEWGQQADDPRHGGVDLHPDGVARITIEPARVEPAADHDGGLWGGGPDDKVQRMVSGLQSSLGRTAVVSPALVGGRAPAGRQALVAWGERPPDARGSRPWPGSLPPPAPASVFGSPLPCRLYGDAAGAPKYPLHVTARGVLTGVPRLLASGREGSMAGLEITSWAGPWPVDDRWWEPGAGGPVARLQVQDAEGLGWLLLQVEGRWYLEARYD